MVLFEATRVVDVSLFEVSCASDLLRPVMFKFKERITSLTRKWLSFQNAYRLILVLTALRTAAGKCQNQTATPPQAFFTQIHHKHYLTAEIINN